MTNTAGTGAPRAQRPGIYLVAGILLVLVITLAIALVVALVRPGGDALTGAHSTPTAGVSNGPDTSLAAPTAASPAPGEPTASAPVATATPAEATATPAPATNHTAAPTAAPTGTPRPTATTAPAATPKPAITSFHAPGSAACGSTIHLSWTATNTSGVRLSIDAPPATAYGAGYMDYPAVGSADLIFPCPPPIENVDTTGSYHLYTITTIHTSGYYTYQYLKVYALA
jgi:hypothetical protein